MPNVLLDKKLASEWRLASCLLHQESLAVEKMSIELNNVLQDS